MDWHGRNTASLISDLGRLKFQPKINTAIQCLRYGDSDHVQHKVQQLEDSQLQDWLKLVHNQDTANQPLRGMRVVISHRPSHTSTLPDDPGAETLSHIPFSRKTFLDLVDQFHLSHSLVRTILRGIIHFSSSTIISTHTARGSAYPQSLHYFNMRMDNSFPRDLAMAASGDVITGMSQALFHGCDEHDVKLLIEWMKMTPCAAGHPMFLPALFSELQLRRHKKLTRDNWKKLVTLQAQTGQYAKHTSNSPFNQLRENACDYDKTTKEVLGIFQNASFLEKSILHFQRKLKRMKEAVVRIEESAPTGHRDFIIVQGARIGERLEEMIDDYEGFLADCKRVSGGASILTNAIWNLIAQRDNITHRSIAADSRRIADDARRDGAAMKTIAMLTMIFLPGTFVAALFAMPMFNWQAPSGRSIISDHFWIYWGVTIPLTAAVLLIWGIWYSVLGSRRV